VNFVVVPPADGVISLYHRNLFNPSSPSVPLLDHSKPLGKKNFGNVGDMTDGTQVLIRTSFDAWQ